MMSIKLKRISLVFAILIFIISLTLPAFHTGKKTDPGYGSFTLFAFGWMGLLFGGAAITWLANPLIIFSWCFFFRSRATSLVFSILALLFAASFLLFRTVLTSEKPDYAAVVAYNSGYWLWLASMIVTIIVTAIPLLASDLPPEKNPAENPFAKR